MMEKLTERIEKYIDAYQLPPWGREVDGTVELLQEVLKKLTEYKTLEEQNLLLRLPCKVSNILYYPDERFNIVIPVRLNEIVMSFVGLDTYSFQYNCCSFDECGDVYQEYEFDKCDINKTVFLTQEEAEQKLKELEGRKDE